MGLVLLPQSVIKNIYTVYSGGAYVNLFARCLNSSTVSVGNQAPLYEALFTYMRVFLQTLFFWTPIKNNVTAYGTVR